VLRVIRKLFVVEKQLLAGCKHKLGVAIYAFQYTINKLHGRLPKDGKFTETGQNPEISPFPFPCPLTCLHNKGPGRAKNQRL
jgi:hypothetical protein